MAADTFTLLSQDHLHFLWQQNLLETILQKVKSSKYLLMIILIHILFKVMMSLSNMLPLNSLFVFQMLFEHREIK